MTASNDRSSELREQGNQAFKQSKFQDAIDRYTEALNLLIELPITEGTKVELTKCYSNRAQCYINLNQYDEAIEDTTRGKEICIDSIDWMLKRYDLALEYTPADQKSLYRRANALEKIGKLNEAISDAQRLISLSSKEGSVDEQTNALLRKLRENAQNRVGRR